MKLKFKVQDYQTNAINAVIDCFAGQPANIMPNHGVNTFNMEFYGRLTTEEFGNDEIHLTDEQLLKNIRTVQERQNLPLAQSFDDFTEFDGVGKVKAKPDTYKPGAKLNLDIEMETGTGKTYCYIKTIFDLNKCYGWSKFVIMVPSIAVREGVYKFFEITADHFKEAYGKKAQFFIYNSQRLHQLESFSSGAGISVMIINIQAFNARGADNRRIYDELDDFQSRRPIDVISGNRPVLILDEPQKMEGQATLEALPKFNPLMIIRYSATHRTNHLKVHRLDALDAYNQKLVKKIAVQGIQTRGLAGTSAYLYLEGIDISKKAPVARIEMEVKFRFGKIVRQLRRLEFGQDLFVKSGNLDQYRGYKISQIDYNQDRVEFTNGVVLQAGEASGDVNEDDIRRIQIREAIKVHLDRERQLFIQDIKVLTLFFIDEVVKYRDYGQDDEKGEYARVFEREYEILKEESLSDSVINDEAYRKYLSQIKGSETHNGYFSIDRNTRQMKDSKVIKRGERAGLSDDVDAYDLILKDKERLLSFEEPTRFIFSHSALREGWDNPNVFVICVLKHSDSTISRRQEVGRGLRISVNQRGERMDQPETVHEINVLTVVASESYRDFVSGLQTEIVGTLANRPHKVNQEYFLGKLIRYEGESIEITSETATKIYQYLVKNDYVDYHDDITDKYHLAREAGELARLPDELEAFSGKIMEIIDDVIDAGKLLEIDDGRRRKNNPLNLKNFKKKEFQQLWSRISRKAVYRVEFESVELIEKAVNALNNLSVTPLQYTIEVGQQHSTVTDEQLRSGRGFEVTGISTEAGKAVHSNVAYDLVGKIAENTHLTRKTVGEILSTVEPQVFNQFRVNPEHFIVEASRLIGEQKATTIIEKLSYDQIEDRYDAGIFTADQTGQDFLRATDKLKKHVFDYCITDSNVERSFVEKLDTSSEVVVYAKLPRGFLIPTPVGDYNPDWAITFRKGSVQHIFFVAETKGSMSSMHLHGIEKTKIECARKFFAELNERIDAEKVKYEVVIDYEKLMDLVI